MTVRPAERNKPIEISFQGTDKLARAQGTTNSSYCCYDEQIYTEAAMRSVATVALTTYCFMELDKCYETVTRLAVILAPIT